jgi:hypothetical protein
MRILPTQQGYQTLLCESLNELARGTDGVFSIGLILARWVYRHHPETDELELCVTKKLKVDMAAAHPEGLAGWRADVANEVNALRKLAGVAGVVRILDVIPEGDGSVHLILEYVPVTPDPLSHCISGVLIGRCFGR